uniref:chondrolectin isoform X1 n=2 Tax=Doryrhamphus excisus TaxID=161450 RepID=UPI0025AE588E|nr:chondrolectin isoform X1 [Doryrhamphus excisus]
MIFNLMRLWILGIVAVKVVHGARVMSGQTVCLGEGVHPCYKMAYFHDVSSRVAFREAELACHMDGGSLLSIESPSEQEHIEHLLQELRSGAGGGTGIADGDFWIGLTRVDGEDQKTPNGVTSCPQLYRWTDGSMASFRNWYFDEPSCGGESCVVMYHQPTALPGVGGAYLYQWNDDRCTMKHNFICKYPPERHLGEEHGNTAEGQGTEATQGSGELLPPQVTLAGTSGTLLLYVIIPTIPLMLLILVAAGSCCFHVLSRSSSRTKVAVRQSNLWISKTPKADVIEA